MRAKRSSLTLSSGDELLSNRFAVMKPPAKIVQFCLPLQTTPELMTYDPGPGRVYGSPSMVKLLQVAQTNAGADIDRNRRVRSDIDVIILICNTISVKQILELKKSKSDKTRFRSDLAIICSEAQDEILHKQERSAL